MINITEQVTLTCFCNNLFLQHGYAIVDLEKLNPSDVEDLCLSKFLALILQVTLIIYLLIFCLLSYPA